MPRLPVTIISTAFVALVAICSIFAETTFGTAVTHAVQVATSTPTNTPTARSSTSGPASQSDIPAVIDELDFGVPVGNGHQPRRLALDSRRQRLYSFNEGLSNPPEGHTISVIDLDTGQIIDLIRLNNRPEPDGPLLSPLSLQVDPYRPRLYAVWGDPYGDATDSSLSIIDTNTLTIIDTLPQVQAVAPGPDRLYLASDTRLWAIEPDSLAELEARELDLRQFNPSLQLNPQANRLYLRRGQPWSLEVFAADTLTPVDSYTPSGEIIRMIPNSTGDRLFIIERSDTSIRLRTLDDDGHALAASRTTTLAENIYGDLPLALTAQTLYWVDQDPATYTYRLQAFSLSDLSPLDSLPLPTLPNDLIVAPGSGLLYAAYGSPGSYVLVIDPAGQTREPIYTALEILDALADPDSDRLYILDDAATLQILDLTGYSEIAQVETGLDMLAPLNRSLAELSLDPSRSRLYLSGNPGRVVDTTTLEVTAYPDLRGQITPDPTGDRVYLTPPCQCQVEQCNTLILDAATLTGSETLFPAEDPLAAPCVYATRLDSQNQLLYTFINNGVAGSNAGSYFAVFDTEPPGPPEEIFTNTAISYNDVTFDAPDRRAFLSHYRQDRSFIERFELQGRTLTQTLQLGGAQGDLAYDPQTDRLYAVNNAALQVFDGDLTLLAETTLPGEFGLLTFDPEHQRLYLGGGNGRLLVVATGGGQLTFPPPPSPAAASNEQQRVFVAPDGTLFRLDGWQLFHSLNEGQTWRRLGRGLPNWPATAVAISPNYEQDQTVLAGFWNFGRAGGLYRSTDSGETWQPTTRGLTDLEIQQITFSPTFAQDQTIFLTTFEDGLFRSTDGGESWTSLAATYAAGAPDRKVSHLAVSPTFAEDGLVIIGYQHLLRSTDGGQTWTSTGLPVGQTAFSPDFATDKLVLTDGRWRSTDGGQTWQPAAVGLEPAPFGVERFLFLSTFATDHTIYLVLHPRAGEPLTLQRSVDAGLSWQALLAGLPPGIELADAVLLPTGELYLTALDGQQITLSPETLTWGHREIDLTQLDLQDLAIAPDETLFVANSAAGVFKSTDKGGTWTETDFPVRAFETQLARLAVAPDGTLFAAAGPAIERSTDNGQTWTYLSEVPTGFMVASLAVSPDFAADDLVVAGGNFTQNRLIRSADGGQTWTVVFDGSTIEGASDVSLLTFSPNFAADGTIYAWLQEVGLLRSTDRGRHWSPVTAPGSEVSRYFAQAIAVSAGGDRLYLGALDGRLLVSEDQGETWLDLTDNVPGSRIWSSALALSGDDTIFLGTDIGIYRSQDGGQTWTRASTGLPINANANTPPSVRALRLSGNRLYAALTTGGLFGSTDRGQSWQSTLTGQPAAGQVPPSPAPGGTPPPNQSSLTPADCATSPTYFGDLWAARISQLGCPVAAQQVTMAEQVFEGGLMFWRSDLAVIYVLPTSAPYSRFDDTWDDSQPAYTCPDLGPSQTPPTPQRGFGNVWCTDPDIRQLLGNAVSSERAFEATLQEFETGLMFQTDRGDIYILENQTNNWTQVK